MPIFESKRDVAGWLVGKPLDVVAVFSTRAALRAFPAFLSTFKRRDLGITSAEATVALQAFRGLTVSWSAAAFPSHLEAIAKTFSSAAASLKVASSIKDANVVNHNVLYAILDAVGVASAYTSESTGMLSPTAADFAIDAIIDQGGPTAFGTLMRALEVDAGVLEERFSPVTLANSQLWSGRIPDWVNEDWGRLKARLLATDKDWVIWTDWYERRLEGEAFNQIVEVGRATISSDKWSEGFFAVNNEIRRLIEQQVIAGGEVGNSTQTLVDQLAALEIDKVAMIGVRVVLRTTPLLFENFAEPELASEILAIFRLISAAWIDLKFSGRAHKEFNAAFQRVSRSKFSITDFVVASVVASASNQMSEDLAREIGIAIGEFRRLSSTLGGPAAVSTFDLALAEDFNDMAAVPASVIAGLPLWPGDSPPEWTLQRWSEMKRKLIEADDGWEVWALWYEDRLAGRVRSEHQEFAYATVPYELWDHGPARVNAWIFNEIEIEPTKKLIPDIPRPGPGPRFQILEHGPIDRVLLAEFDEDGNDVRIINQLRPLALRSASELQERLSRNEFPELLRTVEQYRDSLSPGSHHRINWGEVWGLGVMLQNAASSADRHITQRVLPPLEDPAKASLDSLLSLHGPLILATGDGSTLSAIAQSFAMTREQQDDLRTASEQVAEQLAAHQDVITPFAAASVADAVFTIGEGTHPERGTVYALATVKNLAVVLIGGAAMATPTIIGALLGAPLIGAIAGYPISLLTVEAIKKNSAFVALAARLNEKLDTISDIELGVWIEGRARDLAPFRSFVISNEEPLRKIAASTSELRWMLRYIDFIVGKQ